MPIDQEMHDALADAFCDDAPAPTAEVQHQIDCLKLANNLRREVKVRRDHADDYDAEITSWIEQAEVVVRQAAAVSQPEVQTGGVSALVKAAEDVCAYDYADNTCTELQHDIETLRAAIASVSDAAQAPRSPQQIKAIAADAIRTFCKGLGGAPVQKFHGVERIYYSGLSLDALSAAVALALTSANRDTEQLIKSHRPEGS